MLTIQRKVGSLWFGIGQESIRKMCRMGSDVGRLRQEMERRRRLGEGHSLGDEME